MSKQGRDPILRGEMQSDMDGGAFNIVNVNAVGNVQQATLHVDPSLAEEIGERATGLPFKTLGAAVAAAEPGDVIRLRPGIHAYDGSVEIDDLDGLKIIGDGAVIESASTVNENTKITVSSSAVLIEGIEFNGDVSGTNTTGVTGCIQVGGPSCTIRNCYIHDQNGWGISLSGTYDRIRILDCTIVDCLGGVRGVLAPDTTVSLGPITINRNLIQTNRTYGVSIFGPTNASSYAIIRIEVNDNTFNSNNTIASTYSGLLIHDQCYEISIQRNRFFYEETAIYLNTVKTAQISNNYFKGMATNGMLISGCLNLTVTDNMLDGRNAAGTAVTGAAFNATGNYLVANDSANYLLSGNWFGFLTTSSVAVSISNVTTVLIEGNLFGAWILLAAVVRVQVQNNYIISAATSQGILINAASRATSQITIGSNRFLFNGASIARAICTVDASGFGIDDVLIHGNSFPIGTTFTSASYSHSGSNLPTNVVLLDNTPEAHATAATGWANAQQNLGIARVFVSQSRGDDADGQAQDRSRKFRTINAAITAASSGYEVIVEDGTFDESINAKDGITVRFLPPAKLAVTTAAGCIRTTEEDQTFTIYHEHTPMTCSTASTIGVALSYTGVSIFMHASLVVTGTGASSIAVNVAHGTIEIWGSVSATAATALRTGTNGDDDPFIVMHGGISPITQGFRDVEATTGHAIEITDGGCLIDDCHIYSPSGVYISTASGIDLFRRCMIIATTASSQAVTVVGANTGTLGFRDCTLYAGSSATQSINATGAQTISINGTLNGNKGAEPPTNVTFEGPGTYNVDASMFPF